MSDVETPQPPHNLKSKAETITIKKALWDEMLSNKKRIDMLEDLSGHTCDQLNKRIENLERKITKLEFAEGCHNNLSDKVEKQQKTISKLVDKIAAIGNYCYAEKKPYRCPVCCGSQRDYFDMLYAYNEYPPETQLDHEGRKYVACRACEGKGILWN